MMFTELRDVLIFASSLEMIARSIVQSSALALNYNAILPINISNNALFKPDYSLLRTPYLTILTINDLVV